MVFEDRKAAGRMLAQVLAPFHLRPETIVLALPRGGVPVAYEVARTLNLPLDIFIVRKLGTPGQEELAMGAIASGGTIVLNQDVIDDRSISEAEIEQVASRERLEIERRESEYRGGRSPLRIDGHTVILIDDGMATGASMRAAARALRQRARQIIVAVPVAAKSTCDELQSEVDQIICVTTPKSFAAISMFYRDFEQTTDEEVRTLLSQASVNQQG
jgi:putative phosphoribosyl transferase